MAQLKLTPNEVDVCLYHDKCPDGIGSALAAYLFAKENNKKIEFIGIGVDHDLTTLDLDGKCVVMCDISAKKEKLAALFERVKGFQLIDHHKTAEKDLESIPAELKLFDMKHSGAWLTWRWFYPTGKVPRLIEYIEDRDIWTKRFEESKYFANWFTTIYDLELSEQLPKLVPLLEDLNLEVVVEQGKSFELLINSLLTKESKKAFPELCLLHGKYYITATVNSTVYASDVGNRIMMDQPLIDFAVVYNTKTDTTGFSLRSMDCRTDVSEVAKLYGGGGHRNASGVYHPGIVNRLPGKYLQLDIKQVLEHLAFRVPKIHGAELIVMSVYSDHHKKHLLSLLKERVLNATSGNFLGRLNRARPDRIDLTVVWSFDPIEYVTRGKFIINHNATGDQREAVHDLLHFHRSKPDSFVIKGLVQFDKLRED